MPLSSVVDMAQKRHSWKRNKSLTLFRRSKDTPNPHLSLASQLPDEILLLIFRLIKRDIIDPSQFVLKPRDALQSLPLVSKAWYGPATNVLYEVIDLPRVSSIFKFHQSLIERSHLRSHVKTLVLPGRVSRPCPPRLMRAILQIIDLVESLEVLYSMCQLTPDARPAADAGIYSGGNQVVLPFAASKHRQLKHLELYAHSSTWCLFPKLVVFAFEKLEWLALHGFWIFEKVSPENTPPLPNLTMVVCHHGDVIIALDEWLQSCPKLTTLWLRETAMAILSDDTAPLGLFRKGGVSQLMIHQMYCDAADNETSFNWLRQCESISMLALDWPAFSRCQVPLPVSVDTLMLRVELEKPPLSAIISFLDRNPGLKKFEWEVCRHDQWFISHRSRLETEMSDRGVTFSLDYQSCYCDVTLGKVTSDILNPVAHMAWARLIRNKDIVEMIAWELGS